MLGTNLVKYNDQIVPENSQTAFLAKKKHLEKTYQKLLQILRETDTKLTFFVTGRLYNHSPQMIHDIANEGHEIGWHSHNHVPIISEEVLKQELQDSADFLQKFKPKGFRAPWATFKKIFLPLLKEAGFSYDSSCWGPAGKKYEEAGLILLPVTSFPNFNSAHPNYSLDNKNLAIPFGSNFIFSLLRKNYSLFLKYFKNKSCVFYLHNWQLFPWPERQLSFLKNNLRYIQKFPQIEIMKHLINKHKFSRLDQALKNYNQNHYLTLDME